MGRGGDECGVGHFVDFVTGVEERGGGKYTNGKTTNCTQTLCTIHANCTTILSINQIKKHAVI